MTCLVVESPDKVEVIAEITERWFYTPKIIIILIIYVWV